MAIRLNPAHKGLLRKLAMSEGGIGEGGKIKVDWLKQKAHGSNKDVAKRARFALAARKWHHVGPTGESESLEEDEGDTMNSEPREDQLNRYVEALYDDHNRDFATLSDEDWARFADERDMDIRDLFPRQSAEIRRLIITDRDFSLEERIILAHLFNLPFTGEMIGRLLGITRQGEKKLELRIFRKIRKAWAAKYGEEDLSPSAREDLI